MQRPSHLANPQAGSFLNLNDAALASELRKYQSNARMYGDTTMGREATDNARAIAAEIARRNSPN